MLKSALFAAALFAAHAALAYDGIVKKEVFTMPGYTTVGGKAIRNVRVGYETYGRLNAARDNAVLVCHFFSGSSHAAGRYKADDKLPGYWDAIIGSGRAIDTDKYFVVSVDSLVNLSAKDPNVVTTGPASIDPDTGKPYGMSFPVVTIRDFVNVQEALLRSLGIGKLQAVAGASMGSMQSFVWAAAYPGKVERVIAVIPNDLEAGPYAIMALNAWAAPIRLDPRWNRGDYYGRPEPDDGVTHALNAVAVTARHYGWADKTFGRKWAAPEKNPLHALDNAYVIEAAFTGGSAARAKLIDANHFLYMVKANQLYSLAEGSPEGSYRNIRARTLLVYAKSDLLLFPDYAHNAAAKLRARGTPVEMFAIDGDGGHLEGVTGIGKAAGAIKSFLEGRH
ncbi:MAG: E22 family MetX-like putative esterase [Betaproteobacteria bacterium]